jgi:hypothetical protein
VRTDREAHERGLGQGLATVAGDVAEQQANAAVGQRERIVEVAAGGRAVGRAVGHRGLQRPEAQRHSGQQRGLEQADVLHEPPALAAQAARAGGGDERVGAQQHDERAEDDERDLRRRLDDCGDDPVAWRCWRRLCERRNP